MKVAPAPSAKDERVISRARASDFDLLRGIEKFYLGRFPLEPVALVRILYGTMLFCSYALASTELEQIFGPDSISVFVDPRKAEMFVPRHLWLSHAVLLAACASFALGFLTPISGLIVIFGHLAFRDVSFLQTWGWTRLVHPFVGYLVLANAGGKYSIDAWLLQRFWPSFRPARTTIAWPVRLLQIHITALYLMVAWHRIDNVHWHTGSMVYVALANTVFGRFPLADLQGIKPVLAVMCWIAWLFELGAPVFLWVKKTRTYFVLGLMTMHLGLEIMSTVGWWQFAMLALLWIFLPQKWAKRILGRFALQN